MMFLLLTLTGCAGSRIEVRGFSPEQTERIVSAFEWKKQFCSNGVAAERRDARAEMRYTPERGRQSRSQAVGEFRCN